MQKIFYYSLLLLLFSCGSTKQTNEIEDTTPNWIKNYPVSEDYYTGIGIVSKSKNPENYIQIAQQNALQNLASQIKVKIATESVFVQMEREYGFEEEFKSDIKIKAEEHLEGYQLKGTHQAGDKYWVYYSLSKKKYAEVRQARMEEAIEQAKTLLTFTTHQHSPKERYVHFVKSLEVLKPFLSEPLACQLERRKVFLGSEIIAQFRSFMDDFRIISLDKKVKVMVGNKLGELKFAVEFNKKRVENIPLVFASDILDVKPFNNVTDENGLFVAIVPKISSTESVQKMQVGLDIVSWLNEATTDKFTQKLARGVKSHQITMPVYVYTPLVYVQSKEKYFGTLYRSQDLKFAAETALNKLGFSPTGKKDEAELFMQIEANTKKGGTQADQKMFTAFLDMSIQVKDRREMIVYSEQLNKLKGIQLSFEQANTSAYEKAQEELNKSIIPNFVNSFIQQ